MRLVVPQFWIKVTLLSVLLYPLSIIYQLISFWLSYVPVNKKYNARAKIIRVGNITMGGSGKTPVVIAMLELLKNKKIVILTRGYKGKLAGPIMLTKEHKIDEVGDEALLLAKRAPTCVAKDRLEGIKFLENLGYDIIITDDGMQDNRFKADLTIMVIDSYFGFGNGMIFPSGPLRESIVSGMNKADVTVVIGDGKMPRYPWQDAVGSADRGSHEDTLIKADLVSDINLKNKEFVAFAGIGNPAKFFLSLEKSGAKLMKKIPFPDHYQYTTKDMEYLFSFSKPLITTEKDYVRLEKKYQDRVEILPVRLIWEDNYMERKLINL